MFTGDAIGECVPLFEPAIQPGIDERKEIDGMAKESRNSKGMSRRQFVKVAGATVVAGGTAGGLLSCATVQQVEQTPILDVTPSSIVCDQQKCSGCRICEQVCSEFHYGVYNPKLTAIIVDRGYGGSGDWIDTRTCHQCPNPWCMRVCPVDAIYRDTRTGAVVVDEQACIGCEKCVPACPFGMINMRPDGKKAFKCDLCGGDPQCVASCPMDALTTEPLVWRDRELMGGGK
ncbi:MAG: 4Fe-4S dicluster domain-containing protein [Desulfomonilia bacterium]